MDREDSAHDLLEGILLDENKDPTNFRIGLLKSITDDFSEDQHIGSGGFAKVYKGQLQRGIVAVKKLYELGKVGDFEVYEKKFMQEVDCLMKVKHKNIVRFLGYCFDTQGKVLEYNGKNIIADQRQRFLCFEFLPQGSLDKHISDASNGLEWRTRYHIIKGICEGLQYLHGKKIVHTDLKPENILLDHNMMPKIGDFGLARSFLEEQTSAITQNVFGTFDYMAPESFRGVITFKSDIYSLGVIITEMLTGQKKDDLSIESVHENWSARFKTSNGGTWLEHVTVCAQIALDCMVLDPKKRPIIGQIIDRLDKLERKYGFIGTDLPVPANRVEPSKRKVKKTSVPVHELVYGALAAADLEKAVEKEYEMALQDRVMEETKEKKNAVEAYVYDMRNKLYDKFNDFVTPEEKEGLIAKLQEVEDWLYEDGEDETKGVYISKLEELRKIGDPIEARYKEWTERGSTVDQLVYCINSFREAALSNDQKFDHIDVSEKQKVINECSEAENWLREMKQQQDALPKHANPVLLVSDLKKKAETLDRFCKPIMTKPKPAPKPQTPPPQSPSPQPETHTPEPQTPEQQQSGSGTAGETGSEGGVQETSVDQMDMDDKPDDSAGAAA